MIYDYKTFVEELTEKTNGPEIIKKYTEIYGSFPETLEECAFFEYLNSFNEIKYQIPTEIADSYDWGILLKLIAASFSSDYWFTYENDDNCPELYISVKSGDTSALKKVSELWSFQILRLFEIYFKEQFELQLLTPPESESTGLCKDKQMKLDAYREKQTKVLNELLQRKHTQAIDDLLL
jgi:hypothetical protein